MLKKNALFVVDMQNDFVRTDGALSVPNAKEIIPLINRDLPVYDVIVYTVDWHPKDHTSFIKDWPEHCVQSTFGAELYPELYPCSRGETIRIKKGTDRESHPYGPFSDNDGTNHTGLDVQLKDLGVGAVFVCGVALKFCVKYTAMQAAKAGFVTYILMSHTRDIGTTPDSFYYNMVDAGVVLL